MFSLKTSGLNKEFRCNLCCCLSTGGLDFVNFSQMVSFLASNESYCVNISILEDDIGEVGEYFLLKVELDYTFSVFLDSFNITIGETCRK